jgi:hypothetical protein
VVVLGGEGEGWDEGEGRGGEGGYVNPLSSPHDRRSSSMENWLKWLHRSCESLSLGVLG